MAKGGIRLLGWMSIKGEMAVSWERVGGSCHNLIVESHLVLSWYLFPLHYPGFYLAEREEVSSPRGVSFPTSDAQKVPTSDGAAQPPPAKTFYFFFIYIFR